MSDAKAKPNGFTWEYHGGKRIALSNGPIDALVATGDSESSWLDISDENARIIQDAFNRPTEGERAALIAEARGRFTSIGEKVDNCPAYGWSDQYLLSRLADALEASELDARRYRALKKWHDAPGLPEFDLDEGADALIAADGGTDATD